MNSLQLSEVFFFLGVRQFGSIVTKSFFDPRSGGRRSVCAGLEDRYYQGRMWSRESISMDTLTSREVVSGEQI